MSLSLSFPDQNYSSANKPNAETLKGDLSFIEADVNAHEADTAAHGTIPDKATGAEVDTGTNDTKFVTPKALADQTVLLSTTDTISQRINPRTTTEVSSATPTVNTDESDIHTITALATNITSMTSGLSGTPVNGQKRIVRILDNGTARTIAWGASYASRGATLPTTTVLSKYLYVGLIYNSTASVWDCVAVAQE